MSQRGAPNWESVKAITESCRESGYSTASGDGRLLTMRCRTGASLVVMIVR